ncbi:cation:proton antiporter [Luteimonas abyssi]|uniref:cation:proton antiporter n=1 Tax=Luteimonas abyssi TaxID=1247514 RepID=UPI000737D2A0|nr:monovalent cation/H(+) antiporter subunit G [Luteimonas abyssi]
MQMLTIALIVGGAALLVLSALGLFLLRDALSRQHAATKSATLALGLLLIGVGLQGGDAAWWGRVAVILVLLLITLPVASHMLARAATRHAYTEDELRAVPDAESGADQDARGG